MLVILGVLAGAVMVWSVVYMSKSTTYEKHEDMTITLESIEKIILPNNKGRSIDKVVENIMASGIDVDFHIG